MAEKRATIAKREYIDPDGEKVKRITGATGFRYTYLESGNSVEHQCGEAGQPATMFAVMGGLTKIGNIVNTIKSDEEYDGSDPMPAAEKWLATLAETGLWRPEGTGSSKAPKYDKTVLAQAIVIALGDKAKGDEAHYFNRLTAKNEDDKLSSEARSYFAKVTRHPDILAAYATLADSESDLGDLA